MSKVELSFIHGPKGIANETIRGGMEIIRKTLIDAGFDGIFACKPHKQMTMKGNERLRLGVYDITKRFFTLKVKPGNNGTSWEWLVFTPEAISPLIVHTVLTAKLDQPTEPTIERFHKANGHHHEPPTQPLAEESVAMPEPALPANVIPHANTVPSPEEVSKASLNDLVAALSKAAKRKDVYKQRELHMLNAKRAYEDAELTLLDAQEKHDRAKEIYDQLRAEHTADVDGHASVELLTHFKALVG